MKYRIALAVLATPLVALGTAGTASAAQGSAHATPTAQPHAKVRTTRSFNQRAAAYAMTLRGIPYHYGGTTKRGFDCSGLTQYVYSHTGKRIGRTAQRQYGQFRRISHAAARPGDLVFFHQSGSPRSHVYHVGVYEGGSKMVAAPSTGQRVSLQSFAWAGRTVTFGTVSH
jgi:cell wall-associated NlpC family hydrolase